MSITQLRRGIRRRADGLSVRWVYDSWIFFLSFVRDFLSFFWDFGLSDLDSDLEFVRERGYSEFLFWVDIFLDWVLPHSVDQVFVCFTFGVSLNR